MFGFLKKKDVPTPMRKIYNATSTPTQQITQSNWLLDSKFVASISQNVATETHPILGVLEVQKPIVSGLPNEQNAVYYLVTIEVLNANKVSESPRIDLLALATVQQDGDLTIPLFIS